MPILAGISPSGGVPHRLQRSEAGADVPPVGEGSKTARLSASLGTNAKYSNTAPMEGRIQRFALQSVARSIIPESRTAKCLRIRAHDSDVQVWKSIQYATAQYAGLQTCGSVWACPVCAAKIAERRRVEIIAAMAAHKAAGGCVNMLTLTCPHQRTDSLSDLLKKQAKALHRFWSDRVAKVVFAEMGVIGQIRALEVTHGRKSEHNNGWHPHYHVLQFGGIGVDLARFNDAVQMKDWQVRLYLRWAACCVAVGLGEPSYAHGLKLGDASKAAKYVSKWGLEDEMTKGHTKKALHGETPFDFLRASLADVADVQARALFLEFATTFKGKRQLHWSKGLKARYAIEDVSDDHLSERIEERAVLLGLLTVDQWREVLKVDGRGALLDVAAKVGWPGVQRYLAVIKDVERGLLSKSEIDEIRQLVIAVSVVPRETV